MHKYLLVALILLPLMTAIASPDQAPTFDPLTGSYGFASEDFGGGSYLGVDTRDITPDRVSVLKLKNESGVEVTMVDQDAPAGKAGIKEHDVILTVNGAKVESVEQLRRMIREIPSGRMIDIGVSRNGQPLKLQAQLADRHAAHAMKFHMPAVGPMPNMADFEMPLSVVVVHSSMRSGLMVENLTPQLGDYFGAKNGQGVLVRSVEKGSRAERAGFRAGDVIVRVGKDRVHDSGDFTHALQSNRAQGSVSVGVIRDKKEQNITLSLPPRKESGDLFPEESFEVPDIDIDARAELSDINKQIANLRPEIELAVREAQRQSEAFRKHAGEQQKEQLQQMQKQHQELQKRLREQTSRIQEQFRKNWDEQRKELRRELRELQQSGNEI
jgi:serine protease Do